MTTTQFALARVTPVDLARMRATLFIEGSQAERRSRSSRFWVLLLLAALIASAGVVADSTATVIGAMIVAPLMVPILGTVLAIVTGDRDNLVRCVVMIVAGALAAIAVGYMLGLLAPIDVTAATNSQVAGRIHPRLIDLLAALATGCVGAFAQCRDDVSDALPGVAIAISLVPPLTVVGLTLEAGATGEAMGALLLFLTNVVSILLSGAVVMAIFRVHRVALVGTELNRRNALALIAAVALVIAVPLALSTIKATRTFVVEGQVRDVTEEWAQTNDWNLVRIDQSASEYLITVAGAPPTPPASELRAALDSEGLTEVDVVVRMVLEERVDLDGD